jgi:hypothetical protein
MDNFHKNKTEELPKKNKIYEKLEDGAFAKALERELQLLQKQQIQEFKSHYDYPSKRMN